MNKHDTDTREDDGSGALEYHREACVRCSKGIHEAEQAELDADQQPTDGGDHESRARHGNEQSPLEQEHQSQERTADSLEQEERADRRDAPVAHRPQLEVDRT